MRTPSRRTRLVALAALTPYVLDWRRDRRRDDRTPGPIPYVCLRILDDGSYCLGVWHGCWAARTFGPLTPRLQNWPGKRPAAEDGAS